jgi:hypothetical protein
MRLWLATPMFGSQCAGIFADSMCRLYDMCAHSDLVLSHRFLCNGSNIVALRTQLANEFLASNSDSMLFIDADIGFESQAVIDLLNQHTLTGFDVLGGAYLKKNIHWDQVYNATARLKIRGDIGVNDLKYYTGNYTVELLNGDQFNPNAQLPVEVTFIGAGFMLIPRATLELFQKTYKEYIYGQPPQTLFFSSEIQDNLLISEDVFFCKMIRRAGGKIGCLPWLKLGHFGHHVYGGGTFF